MKLDVHNTNNFGLHYKMTQEIGTETSVFVHEKVLTFHFGAFSFACLSLVYYSL